MCVGVHGMARLGELLPDPKLYPDRVLRWSSVTMVSANHATIHLPTCKTDPFSKGSTIHLFATGEVTCPVQTLLRIWNPHAAGRFRDQLLFAADGHGLLSRPTFIRCLRHLVGLTEARYHWGLQQHLFAGHSLRRGGASSLAARGVPDRIIQMLGRWSSDCYRIYIEHDVTFVESIFGKMRISAPEVLRHDLAIALRPGANSKHLWDCTD